MTIDFVKIKQLNQAKQALLAERPELEALQAEIDTALNNCGKNRHNRMATMQALMLQKTKELIEQLNELKMAIELKRN